MFGRTLPKCSKTKNTKLSVTDPITKDRAYIYTIYTNIFSTRIFHKKYLRIFPKKSYFLQDLKAPSRRFLFSVFWFFFFFLFETTSLGLWCSETQSVGRNGQHTRRNQTGRPNQNKRKNQTCSSEIRNRTNWTGRYTEHFENRGFNEILGFVVFRDASCCGC